MFQKFSSLSTLNKYRYMFLMLLMLMLNSLDAGAITPLWGSFIKSIGGGLKAAGVAVAILNVGGAIFTAIFSAIEAKWSKYTRLYVVGSFVLFAAFYFYYFFVTDVTRLYIVLVGLALANGIVWPAFDALYEKTFDDSTAALGWGAQTSFDSIGTGIGAFIGSHLASGFNFHLLFAVMFVAALIAAFLSFIGLPKSGNNKPVETNPTTTI